MRVFVAGGTGTLGRPAVRQLVAAGHEVRGLARTPERGEVLRSLGAEPVVADLFDARAMTAAVDGMEAILHIATRIPPLNRMREYMRDGRLWVYVSGENRPVAYLMAELLDGDGHIAQVSVHPLHARQGIGAALIDQAAAWAAGQGARALTLTAFSNVPWNGPYYERLGFVPLADDDLPPGLKAVRAQEIARGLDRWPRAAMRRELP